MPVSLLSEDTINKIAAGEVVERPANVVKELLENALDAGATHIHIDITRAGRTLIRVSDDGVGMSKDDLLLAVQRHATSKITSFTDLSTTTSLGFRGEALPSIAAVSRMTLRSQPMGDPLGGWELKLDGGKRIHSKAWAGSTGTIVEVEELFFNTPAREKFLKSDATERNRALACIDETALAWHERAVTAVVEGKTRLDAPPRRSLRERIADVLGPAIAGQLLEITVSHPRMALTAFVTPISHALSTRNTQFLFVNRRPVNPPKFLVRALYDAYRETLPVGTHPGMIAYVTIDPSSIDVNIHPTKREVRFAHEQEIYHLFQTAVREAITRDRAIPPPQDPSTAHHAVPPTAARVTHTVSGAATPAALREDAGDLYIPAPRPGQEETTPAVIPFGHVFGTYGVAVWRDTLIIVDQHAAAERVRYERYRCQWQSLTIMRQALLLPLTIELSSSQRGTIIDALPLLQEAGWDVEEFGASAILLRAVPAVLGTDRDSTAVFMAAVESLREGATLPSPERIETIIRTACHESLKAHEHLSPQELTRLIIDLFACEMPHTCPHGRPTYRSFTARDLEKMFGRV